MGHAQCQVHLKLEIMYDKTCLRDLPNEIRFNEVAEYYNATRDMVESAILVCGGPGEVLTFFVSGGCHVDTVCVVQVAPDLYYDHFKSACVELVPFNNN